MQLHEDLVILGSPCNSDEDSIRGLSERLIEKGYVRPEFMAQVLKSEKTFPTGLPTEIPFALPHTDIWYCLEPAIAVCVPKKALKFGQMGAEPGQTVDAQAVFMLSITRPEQQVGWIHRLVDCFQNPVTLRKVIDAEDEKAVVTLMKTLLGV